MDLRAIATPPTDAERETVDHLLGLEPEGELGLPPREANSRRHLLLPTLHAIQSRFGWITPGALGYTCRRLHVPPADGYGVASFYALFALSARPPTVVHVCDDIACKARGADALIDSLSRDVGEARQSTADGSATWMRSPCLGLCEQAPAALLVAAGPEPAESGFGHATVERVRDSLATGRAPDWAQAAIPQRDIPGAPPLRLLRRVGRVDPTSLDDYRREGGYRALRIALDVGSTSVIREVTDSGLLGRGGAAFPTGRKWDAVARQPVRPHYVVCNADESEPGTFKDRVLMEEDPFAIVESMTIAGLAVGAEHGYLYLRAEYPMAAARIENAITQARARGLLGADIMGRGARFDLEIRRGAGAYICGEETALFSSLEGFRGEPRSKPPFPVEVGLFGKPTVVNNVETLVNVLDILVEGAAGYRVFGTQASPGTRLFCLSGHVTRPGLYEVPFGTRLDALLELAGGVANGRRLSTILLGGAAGTFVTPDELSMPLTFEDTRKAGNTLGSGVVLVLDDSIDLPDYLHRVAGFFRDESCGQCVPCRVGTVRQEELVTRLVRKSPLGSIEQETALLRDLGQAMRDASICGLGQTASSAIESAVAKLGVLGPRPASLLVAPPNPPLRGRPQRGRDERRSMTAGDKLVPLRRSIELSVDGRKVRVPEGATLLDACRSLGIDTPTMCWAENLTPVNVCRVCVVEVEGARVLAPACSRKAEAGMVVQTDSERVRTSRKLVLELLASSVDLSTAPAYADYAKRYGADPSRFGPRAEPATPGTRDHAEAGHHHASSGDSAETVAQPVKVDNDLYVRDYAKCILCYKCVEACGDDAQSTFAIAVAGRGFEARISTELNVPLTDSACVYCGNCIGVCPTGALMFKTEHDLRASGAWDESRQHVADTICPYCGVGCTLTVRVQDNRIVRVTSPSDHSVTSGHLCIKGRFGWQFVQAAPPEEAAPHAPHPDPLPGRGEGA